MIHHCFLDIYPKQLQHDTRHSDFSISRSINTLNIYETMLDIDLWHPNATLGNYLVPFLSKRTNKN